MNKYIVVYPFKEPTEVESEGWELINGTTLHFFNTSNGYTETVRVFGPHSGWLEFAKEGKV